MDDLRERIADITLGRLSVTDEEELMKLIHEREREARIEIANWAIEYTGKIELENPAPGDMWRTFKFIRNGMRDHFKAAYGVDPNTNYNPVKAVLPPLRLQATKPEKKPNPKLQDWSAL